NAVSSGLRWQPTTVTTPSFVIGSGANRAAMIMVIMTENVATGITATLGGVSGTLIPGTDTGTPATVRTLIFRVANPPSGAQTATARGRTASRERRSALLPWAAPIKPRRARTGRSSPAI